MDDRQFWVQRKVTSGALIGLFTALTVVLLVIAIGSFVGGQVIGGVVLLFGAVIVGSQVWRRKVAYDIARRELDKYPK